MGKRLFIAIALPEEIRRLLAEIGKRFKKKVGEHLVKWVEKNNFHQTMVFLGDVDQGRFDDLEKIIAEWEQKPSLKLFLKRVGFFPDRKRPRLIWVELGGEVDKLSSYYHQLRIILEKSGFDFDTRFSPHITLGRIRFNQSKAYFPKRITDQINEDLHSQETSFKATKLILFESHLTPKGPIYNSIKEVALAKV